MKITPRISVAMTTYNGERFLKEQLESIKYQSCLPDELVVCDDCSSDKTISILEDFKKEVNFDVKIYKNDNKIGSVLNFEKAIFLCEGDIILLSDQDDLWMPGRVERSVKTLAIDDRCGFCFSDAQCIDEKSSIVNDSLWDRFDFDSNRQSNFNNKENQIIELLKANFITGATLAFKSNLRDFFLPMPRRPGLHHDYWIALSLTSTDNFGIASSEPFIQYRIHNKQQVGAPPERLSLDNRINSRCKNLNNSLNAEISLIDELFRHTALKKNITQKIVKHRLRLKHRLSLVRNRNVFKRTVGVLIYLFRGGYSYVKYPPLSALKDILH